MNNLILPHSTEFQYYPSVLTYSEVLLGLLNGCIQIINACSISSQNWTSDDCVTSYCRGGVNQTWILKNSKDLLEFM